MRSLATCDGRIWLEEVERQFESELMQSTAPVLQEPNLLNTNTIQGRPGVACALKVSSIRSAVLTQLTIVTGVTTSHLQGVTR